MSPIITVNNLHKEFRLKTKQPGFMNSLKSLWKAEYKNVTAVDNISFEVQRGEKIAFIGPNGAGKSTTIKIMTGIMHPTSGEINVLGLNPQKDRQKLAYQIGSVFGQKGQMWLHLPATDSLRLMGRIYDMSALEINKRIDELKEVFDLSEFIDQPVRKLSLGQRMRCEVAAALFHKPQIIFLDEPTIGLDVVAKSKLRETLNNLNVSNQTTIFLTSHDTGDLEEVCNKVMIINHGQMIFDDSLNKFKTDYLGEKIVKVIYEGEVNPTQKEKITKLLNGDNQVIWHKEAFELEVVVRNFKQIGEIVKQLYEHLEVVDLSIGYPSTEEIIKGIYGN